MSDRKNWNLYKITLSGMLAALSVVLVLLVHFPIIPAAPWLEYDAADIPVLLGGFIIGPWFGAAILAVASFIQAFMLGGNGVIGFIMHFVATLFLLLVSSFIYKIINKLWGLIVGLSAGALCMALIMVPLNIIFTPLLVNGPSVEAVIDMILPVIIPFNLIKASVNAFLGAVFFLSSKKFLSVYIKRLNGK